MSATPDQARPQRRRLQQDALSGFLGFFAFVAVLQAVLNVFQPEPQVWPALLALALVTATWWSWRVGRRGRAGRHTSQPE